jgi:hypothetical protein
MDDQPKQKKQGPDSRLEWAKVLATLTDAASRILDLLRR